MACKSGHIDCSNEDIRCDLCFNDIHYVQKKIKSTGINKRAAKVTKRAGANFEFENHKTNNHVLSGKLSAMTPNSGAGRIKGDEQIRGFLSIMEELKTSVQTTTKGKKTFTIQKNWLDKLRKEALEEKKEFWYLKFAFGDHEEDWYTILEAPIAMSMVQTMHEDRKARHEAEAKIDVANKRADLYLAEKAKANAEIEYLKALLKEKEFEIESLKK